MSKYDFSADHQSDYGEIGRQDCTLLLINQGGLLCFLPPRHRQNEPVVLHQGICRQRAFYHEKQTICMATVFENLRPQHVLSTVCLCNVRIINSEDEKFITSLKYIYSTTLFLLLCNLSFLYVDKEIN